MILDEMDKATRKKISRALTGRKRPESVKRKISKSMEGHSNFEGKHHDKSTKKELKKERGHDDRVKGRRWRTEKHTDEESRVYTKGDPKKYRWGRALAEWVELEEARTNPEQNPKLSVVDQLKTQVADVDSVPGTAIPNLFVSFTEIDKLGINPKSPHNTPLGIYAYPVDYVLNEVEFYGSDKMKDALPYASVRKYATSFSVTGNIIVLDTISERDADLYLGKLWRVVQYYAEQGTTREQSEQVVERYVEKSYSKARFQTPGGRFWYVLYALAYNELKQYEAPKTWNKMMRMIGIDGCIDTGKGIIHTNEPCQAVFFTRGAITNEHRMLNRSGVTATDEARRTGIAAKELDAAFRATTDPVEFDKLVEDNVVSKPTNAKYIRGKFWQQRALDQTRVWSMLSYFPNPTDELIVNTLTNPAVSDQAAKIVAMKMKTPSTNVLLQLAAERPNLVGQFSNVPAPEVVEPVIDQYPNVIKHLQPELQRFFAARRQIQAARDV